MATYDGDEDIGPRALPRWGFVNGENHTEEEDRMLRNIDLQRKGLVVLFAKEMKCEACGNLRECTQARHEGKQKMLCTPCIRTQWAPETTKTVSKIVDLMSALRQRRGGPYYVTLPGEEEKRIVHLASVRQVKDLLCRELNRKRVPKGTRIWPVP